VVVIVSSFQVSVGLHLRGAPKKPRKAQSVSWLVASSELQARLVAFTPQQSRLVMYFKQITLEKRLAIPDFRYAVSYMNPPIVYDLIRLYFIVLITRLYK
jgi:hypothetical protein